MGPYGLNKSSLRAPVARVRGLGSAKDGTGHFITQRVTALALVPLLLWFVVGVISHIGVPHYTFKAWLGGIVPATLMVLTLVTTFWHAALGLAVVVEDYVHHEMLKLALLVLVRLGCVGFAVLGVVSVIKIAVSN